MKQSHILLFVLLLLRQLHCKGLLLQNQDLLLFGLLLGATCNFPTLTVAWSHHNHLVNLRLVLSRSRV